MTGTLAHLPHGDVADRVVLVAPERGAVVDLAGPGVARTDLDTMDLTRGRPVSS